MTTLQRAQRLLASRSQLAPLLLRVGLGAVFLAHSYAKLSIFTIAGTQQYFEAHGFPAWSVFPVLAIELLGGLGMVLGFHTRLCALALLPVAAGALIPHLGNGWMFTNAGGGWEYVAFLIVALAAQLLAGGGALRLSSEEAAPELASRAAHSGSDTRNSAPLSCATNSACP